MTLATNNASVSTITSSVTNYSLSPAPLATTLVSSLTPGQRLITSDRLINDVQCVDCHTHPSPQLLHRVPIVSSHDLLTLYLQNLATLECQEPHMFPRREGDCNSDITPGLSEIYIKCNQIVFKLPLTTCEGAVAWLPLKPDLKFEPRLAFSLSQIFYLSIMSCATSSDIKRSHYKCLVSYQRSNLATTSNINRASMNVIKQINLILHLICP